MKTLNNFFEKAHLFKVWLVLYPTFVLTVSLLTYGMDAVTLDFTFGKHINYVYFGVLTSVPFSIMYILMISMSRKSNIFWAYASLLEEKINNVNTKQELKHIFYNEYNQLVDKCDGGPQIGEVKRIRAIIETRLKYWGK